MSPPNDPPRGPGGRTVLGVGPQNSQLPGAPRVAPAAQPAGVRANNNGLAAAPPGRSPTSDAPTATRARPDDPSVSQAPTLPGTPATDLRAQAARSASLMPNPPRMSGAPAAPSAPSNPVRLYLDEDERRPARATDDGSKLWLYAVILLVLAGGGWLGINMLSSKSSTPDVPAAVPPRVEVPTPAPAVVPTPEAPATTGTGTTAALPTPAAQPAAQPQAKAPEAEPAKEPTPEPAAAAEPDKGSDSRGGSGKSSRGGGGDGKDPTDYGGWVTKGDRAFSRGELDVARTSYQSALAMRATGSEANTGLGFTLLAEGRAKDAIPHFDRAAGSGYADASIGLGDAYRRLGQKSQAAEAYKDYLERLPNGSRASYAKAQLTALGEGGGGGGKPSAPAPAEEEAPSGSSDYRPAGEVDAPAPEPSAPAGEATP
jgi:hypothetical protein